MCAIYRLHQDIVLLKAEVAELLFPNVLMNLVGRVDSKYGHLPFNVKEGPEVANSI